MSAIAPAGKPNNSTGSVAAVCIRAMSSGEAVRAVISHVPAVSCIQLPVFEMTEATRRSRKTGWRSGSQAAFTSRSGRVSEREAVAAQSPEACIAAANGSKPGKEVMDRMGATVRMTMGRRVLYQRNAYSRRDRKLGWGAVATEHPHWGPLRQDGNGREPLVRLKP